MRSLKFGVLVYHQSKLNKQFMSQIEQDKKSQEFINKLANHQTEATNLWMKKRQTLKQQDRIKNFMTAFMENEQFLFLNRGIYRLKIQMFLDTVFLEEDPNIYQQKLAILKNQLIKKTTKQETIPGEQIQISIFYDTRRMEKEYRYKQLALQRWIQLFIKKELKKIAFDLRTQVKDKRILEGKQERKDTYTGIYLFDPFFNCVKIKMFKTNGSLFNGKFKIQSQNIKQFKHIPDTNDQTWKDSSDFKLTHTINQLLQYIFEKENGQPEDQVIIQDFFNKQRLKILSDLEYKTQDIIKVMPIKKWANQIDAQLQKIQSLAKRNQKEKKQMSLSKQENYRKANSHKILRYVYYLANNQNRKGLQTLNRNIPLLNPQIVQNAFKIIEKELQMQQLLFKLCKYFKAFCITDNQKIQKGIAKLGTPNGILFYGPPGTGKTRLTQDLAELMGMHPISIGVSSADFMKQLVGQAKGTVSSYLKRPELSPHLMCSFAIDQFDAIVGDRRNKESKNGEAVAMFLSGLGGNQNIENLLVFGSTNFRNNIDEAILRRFSPNFYVNLPGLEERLKIIKGQLPNLGQRELSFLSRITPNFSGAALNNVCHNLGLLINEKHNNKVFQQKQLIQIVSSVGEDFKLKFGNETYPRLYKRVSKQISLDMIKSAFNNLIIIEKQQNNKSKNQFKLIFTKQQKEWNIQRMVPFLQIKEVELNLSFSESQSFKPLSLWIQRSINRYDRQVQIILEDNENNAFHHYKRYDNPTILMINIKRQDFFSNNIFFDQPQNNLYVIYYVEGIKGQQIFKMSKYKICYEPKVYTGRIIVDLTNKMNSSMIFQRKRTFTCPLRIQKKNILQKQEVLSSNEALPQIIEFLMSKKIDYIQMIDRQMMSDNNAFNDQTCLKTMTLKIEQTSNYKTSGIIIDASSFLSVNKPIRQGQKEQNASMNINQPALYKNLINLTNRYAFIDQQSEKWIAIIVEDEQLLKMLKRDLKWPDSPEEQEQKFKQQKKKKSELAKKQFRMCIKCSQVYTGQQNQKQKTCKQHYGYFIDERSFIIKKELTLDQARKNQVQMNLQVTDKSQKKGYRYSCCYKYIDQEPCEYFYHWYGHQGQDQLNHPLKLAQEKLPKWQRECKEIRNLIFR